MNFYKLNQLINEYSEKTIENLTRRFLKEEPTLTLSIIRNYINRFERIKDNLQNKDINTYAWKELEAAVDGYGGKQRIKAGKLNSTVTDANLLYNKDKIRIYLGKDKKSCIKYSNGYTFCIGARGEENMYGHYRLDKKGTPYFIFNDNLPDTDERHLIVLFVYKDSTFPRYSLTLAPNKQEHIYNSLEEIIKAYSWLSVLKNFIDDNKKGTVEPEPFEHLEHIIDNAYDFGKAQSFYFPQEDGKWITVLEERFYITLRGVIEESKPGALDNFLKEKGTKLAYVRIYPFFEGISSPMWNPRYFSFFCDNSEEFKNNIKKKLKILIKEFYEPIHPNIVPINLIHNVPSLEEAIKKVLSSFEENKDKLYNLLDKNKELKEILTTKIDKKVKYDESMDGKYIADDSLVVPNFIIQVNYPRSEALKFIEYNDVHIKHLLENKANRNKALSYIKSLNEEDQKKLLNIYNYVLSFNQIEVDKEASSQIIFKLIKYIIKYMDISKINEKDKIALMKIALDSKYF